VTTTVAKRAVDDRTLWRQRLWKALGALLLVRLVALALNRTDLFFDEAQYWTWSLEPAFGYYSKPPLIAWAIALSTSVCGPAEFCIRLPSPLMHTATAAIVFALGARLYSPRTGFLAALAFATLPGISLSAGIISTDVPLLMAWAMALAGFAALIDEREAWWPALLLGAGIGLGLNAKYAMAYFVLCAGIYIAVTPTRRWLLADKRLWAALGIGVLLIAPNLIWNATNSFATFSHTADNAKWGGALFHPNKALEFFSAQFGVFGPVLFGALLVVIWRWWKLGLPETDRLLLAFCLPVVVIVTLQAFLSRAHANWAAPAYVSATLLVIAGLEREANQRWLKASYWISGVVMAALVLGVAMAGRITLPGVGDPFVRTLGWNEVAAATRAKLDAARILGQPFGAVITDERALTAELLYYMREERTPVLAWLGGERPQDHYELKRPFAKGSPEPVLLVAMRTDSEAILKRFKRATLLVREDLAAGRATRRVTYYRLEGFHGN
jgi:4-amino-4-deoxy-L-arabinose transferase-like glycosyltransferase